MRVGARGPPRGRFWFLFAASGKGSLSLSLSSLQVNTGDAVHAYIREAIAYAVVHVYTHVVPCLCGYPDWQYLCNCSKLLLYENVVCHALSLCGWQMDAYTNQVVCNLPRTMGCRTHTINIHIPACFRGVISTPCREILPGRKYR
jgi:hypothetical protein